MAIDRKAKVVVMGGTERAVPTFKSLASRQDIEIPLAIIMLGYEDEHQYAKKLVMLAREHSIVHHLVDHINEEIIEQCIKLKPDVIIGMGVWRSIMPGRFLRAAHYGFLGLHGTGLPDYRGWAGINWQIINGEPELRMRALQLDEGVDNGPLIYKADGTPLEYAIDLQNEKHLSDIFDEYNSIHIIACNEIIDLVVNDSITFRNQNEAYATYACHRGPADGEINWADNTLSVFNFIRAQSKPYQGAFTYFKGKKITLWRVSPRLDYKNYKGRIPGKIVTRDMDTGKVVILTGDGGLEVIEAQEHGQPQRSPVQIFNSVRNKCVSRTEAYLDAIGFD